MASTQSSYTQTDKVTVEQQPRILRPGWTGVDEVVKSLENRHRASTTISDSIRGEDTADCGGFSDEESDDEWDLAGIKIDRPSMKDVYARYETFEEEDWPIQLTQKPIELALAGFYYRGDSDCVICYSCGRRFHGWKAHEKPMQEHLDGSPNCTFAKYYGKNLAKLIRELNVKMKKHGNYVGIDEVDGMC